MADKLESYFKKHLSDETPGEENWNVPSDDVWDKVLPEIRKKPGLFIPWRYFYWIAILMVLGTASIIWMVNSPVENNEENNAHQSIANTLTDTSAETNPTTNNKVTESDDINSSEFTESTISTKETNNKSDNHQKQISLTTTGSGVEFGENISTVQTDEDFYEQKNTQLNSIIKSVTIKQSVQPYFIDAKSIDEIALDDGPYPLEFRPSGSVVDNDKPTTIKEPINNKGKWGIGAFVKPGWNGTYLTGELNTGLVKASDMFLYSTNWGLELRYHISNRFTLVTGVERSELKSWSKSAVEFAYDSSTEHMMPDGEMENTSPVPMQTPFGEIDTKITYRFPGDQTIPDGEPMLSTMETHQQLRYLSIPLGLEFNIIRFSRFNWFAEGGLRYNRALKDATQFTSRVLHEGHDMDVVAEEMTSHPVYTDQYLNFYIGTGMSYQFSKSFQIIGSGRYFGNITNVNLQDNMSTYVHGLNLKFGIVYIF